jgi:hypothetical protein
MLLSKSKNEEEEQTRTEQRSKIKKKQREQGFRLPKGWKDEGEFPKLSRGRIKDVTASGGCSR